MRNALLFTLLVSSTAGVVVACSSSDPNPASPSVVDGGQADGAPANSVDAAGWPSVLAVPLTNPCNLAYHMHLQVGGGTYEVTVDTGSTTLALASSLCTNCTGISNPYTPAADADTHESTSALYGDGSGWTGEIVQDTVEIPGSQLSVPVRFAAMKSQSNFFKSSPACTPGGQGVFGLGPQSELVSGTESPLDKLHLGGMPDVYAVQLCYGKGTLWFGGFDKAAGTGGPIYVPMISQAGPGTAQPNYAIDVEDMQIGDASIVTSKPFGAVAVDTGSTLNHLGDAYAGLVAKVTATSAWNDLTGGQAFFGSQSCFVPPAGKGIDDMNALLPHLTVTLAGGQTLDLPPVGSYLQPQTLEQKLAFCPGVDGQSFTAAAVQGLFGDVMLRSYVTIFDRANLRIGFMPYKHDANCQ
jgi:hypothetical protein